MEKSEKVTFKKKTIKGKGRARTRQEDDFSGVSLFKLKARDSPEPQRSGQVSRLAKYSALAAEAQERVDVTAELEIAEDVDGDHLVALKDTDESNLAPQQTAQPAATFVLKHSHFRDGEDTLKLYGLKDEYDLKNEYGEDVEDAKAEMPNADIDVEMEDVDAAVDVRKATHNTEMYDMEIMSLSSEDELPEKVRVSQIKSVPQMIETLKSTVLELRARVGLRRDRLGEIRGLLGEARATRQQLVAEL